jgi:hypothetical protein
VERGGALTEAERDLVQDGPPAPRPAIWVLPIDQYLREPPEGMLVRLGGIARWG